MIEVSSYTADQWASMRSGGALPPLEPVRTRGFWLYAAHNQLSQWNAAPDWEAMRESMRQTWEARADQFLVNIAPVWEPGVLHADTGGRWAACGLDRADSSLGPVYSVADASRVTCPECVEALA